MRAALKSRMEQEPENTLPDAGQAFLEQSRRLLGAEYMPKIERCVRLLPEEDLWWRSDPASNSVGNLLLHLAGNLRQWITHGVGGAPDRRTRSAEFDAGGGRSADEMLAHLAAAVAEADRVLAALPPARLFDRRRIQGIDVSVLEAVYHVVEHFSTHVGQIIYITKMRTGKDLQFYAMNADGSVRRGWLPPLEDG